MFKPRGASLQKVVARDFSFPVLGLFRNLSKLMRDPLLLSVEWDSLPRLQSSAYQLMLSSVKTLRGGLWVKMCFRSHDVWGCTEWRYQDPGMLPKSFVPIHERLPHINTSKVLSNFHLEFLCRHLQVFFYCLQVTRVFRKRVTASAVGEWQTLFLFFFHFTIPWGCSSACVLVDFQSLP